MMLYTTMPTPLIKNAPPLTFAFNLLLPFGSIAIPTPVACPTIRLSYLVDQYERFFHSPCQQLVFCRLCHQLYYTGSSSRAFSWVGSSGNVEVAYARKQKSRENVFYDSMKRKQKQG